MSDESKKTENTIVVEVTTGQPLSDDTSTNLRDGGIETRRQKDSEPALRKDSQKVDIRRHKMDTFLNGPNPAPTEREIRLLERIYTAAREEATQSMYSNACRLPYQTQEGLYSYARESYVALLETLKHSLQCILAAVGEDSDEYNLRYDQILHLEKDAEEFSQLFARYRYQKEEAEKNKAAVDKAQLANQILMDDLRSTEKKNVPSMSHSKVSRSKTGSSVSKTSSYYLKRQQEVRDRERKLQDKMDQMKIDEEKRRVEKELAEKQRCIQLEVERARHDLEQKQARAEIEKERQRIQEDRELLQELDLHSDGSHISVRSAMRKDQPPMYATHKVNLPCGNQSVPQAGKVPKIEMLGGDDYTYPSHNGHLNHARDKKVFNRDNTTVPLQYSSGIQQGRLIHDGYAVARCIDAIDKKFGGDYRDWQDFTLDVERMSVRLGTDALGMEYMMDCLVKMCTGDPLDIVMSSRRRYPDARDAFDDAMKKLTDMYGKVRLIMRKRIEDVTRHDRAKWEAQSLQKLYLELDDCLILNDNRLWAEELNGPTVVERVIRNRLPMDSARKLTNVLVKEDRELPTFKELVEFVRCEFHRASHRLNEPWVEGADGTGKRPHNQAGGLDKYKRGGRMNNTSSSGVDAGGPAMDAKTEKKCTVCNRPERHTMSKCKVFRDMDLNGRWEIVRKQRLCIACLGWGHGYRDCPSERCCYHCKDKKHNSLLCKEGKKRDQEDNLQSADNARANMLTNPESEPVEVESAVIGNCVFNSLTSRRYLPVIPVILTHRRTGKKTKVNVLLDTGCDTSCLEMKVAKQLGVEGVVYQLTLNTVNGETKKDCILDDFEIKGLNCPRSFPLERVSCVTELNITHSNPLKKQLNLDRYPHLKGLQLPVFEDCRIDLIIGVDHEELLDLTNPRRGPKGAPVAKLSPFGYLIVGQESDCGTVHAQINNMRLLRDDKSAAVEPLITESVCSGELESCRKLHEEINRYFYCDYDEYCDDDDVVPSLDDERANKIYSESIKLVNGKWEMKMPLAKDDVTLPNNYAYAVKRLNCLSKMLAKSPEKYKFYCEKMDDLKTNHLELVTERTVVHHPGRIWHIPHTLTTQAKPRVVYDGPAEYLGQSLNKCLLTGPDNVQKLTDVLVRFRENAVAYTLDLTNMFMSVQIAEEHRDLMRILWFKDDELGGEVEVYRLKDLAYGFSCSSSMATHALQQTAELNASGACEKAVRMTRESYYVDDCLDSDETEEIACRVILDHIKMLHTGGFRAHKICSGSRAVMEAVGRDRWTPALQEMVELDENQMPGHKVLGISWKPDDDLLAVIVSLDQKDPTKRGLWSMIAQVFDPIGICAPFILTGRRILQKVCKSVDGWDQVIPEELRKMWRNWCAQLHCLERIKIPRCYTLSGRADLYELHTFADASNKGKGCVSYLRSLKDEKVHVAFVRGRAKVVPEDVCTTIPKLELQAAEIASQMHKRIKGSLRLPIQNGFLWSDSTTVLAWISASAIRHNKYTARKLANIRRCSGGDMWLYIGTASNPADHASRGIPPKKADVNHPWIQGPRLLWDEHESWESVLKRSPDDVYQPVVNINKIVLRDATDEVDVCCYTHAGVSRIGDSDVGQQAATENDQILASVELKKKRMHPMPEALRRPVVLHCSLYDVCKSIAVRWRYVNNILARARLADKMSGCLTVNEVQHALKQAVRVCQEDCFSHAMLDLIYREGFEVALKKANKAQRKYLSLVENLNPFVDDEFILRVGGRLQRSGLPFESIHQMILPKRHRITELVIMKEHYASGHLGHNYVLAQIMKQFWVVHGICTTKHYLETCIYCRERRGKLAQQIMAPLPTCRSNKPKFCWQNCGVDLFGPMLARVRRCEVKRYGLILTCMATRAVHLELLEDMTTSAFIQGLLRFLGRRGHKTEEIYSDCGSNFKGAHDELKSIMKIVDKKQLERLGISAVLEGNTVLAQEFNAIDKTKVAAVMSRRNIDIKWNFNSPGASNQGGAWERLIKDTKRIKAALIMKGFEGVPALRHRKPSDFELGTILCEVESILNSRPMTKISTNPDDWGTLTPQAILTGCLDIMSPVDVFNKADQYRANWRYTQVVAVQFWERWLTLYLPWLQVRSKWRSKKPNLKVGDVVMLLDVETEGRMTYPKARIIETFPDQFENVRNVRVQLADGRRFKRALNKIVPLECDAHEE